MRETQGGGRRRAGIIKVNTVSQLEECLWPKGSERDVWMIVDSARDRRVFGLLLECFYSTMSCPFALPVAPRLEDVAPYLIPLDHDDEKTRKFLSRAWGNSWGVFLRSNKSQDRLRRHLRSLISVQDPRGQRLLFRYYDPRVLRTYLPTCNSGELDYVFGPIECFWTESKIPEHLLEFRLDGGGLAERTISLEPGATNPGLDRAPRFDELRQPMLQKTPRIRPEQIAAFSREEVQKFEEWTLARLTRFFPRQCASAGDAGMRQRIREGIERATNYGIRSQRDVSKFMDLETFFGPDFESDPLFPRAIDILEGSVASPAKMMALRRYIKKCVAGVS
jgi:hypothetical protein